METMTTGKRDLVKKFVHVYFAFSMYLSYCGLGKSKGQRKANKRSPIFWEINKALKPSLKKMYGFSAVWVDLVGSLIMLQTAGLFWLKHILLV